MIRTGFMMVCLALAVHVAWAEPANEADKLFERGNQFVQKKSFARAKAEYERALKISPNHLNALYNLAVVCERLGKNDEAMAHYRRYLELRPNDADAWTQLGVRYDEAGKKSEAQAAYEKALALNPKFGWAHHNLGVLLKEQGKPAEARKHLETFLKLEEDAGRRTGEAYYSLGVLELAQRRFKEAKLLLQKALDTNPNQPIFNNAMGEVYLGDGNFSLALTHYQKAVEQDPKYAPAYSGLGDTYRQLKETEKAAAAYRKALELRPDYHLVDFKLGLLLEPIDPAAAIKHFENYLGSGTSAEFRQDAAARLEKLKAKKT